MFMGLRCLADVELFVPVLRLNLDKSDEATVADIFYRCVLDYENKYQESVYEAKLFALQQCIHNARMQVKVACDQRVEVLNRFRRTPQAGR